MMKHRKHVAEDIDVLGTHKVRASMEPLALASSLLQSRATYLSVLAGLSVVALGQSQSVLANGNDKEVKVPARIAQRGAEIVADLNSRCTTPELLRRQTNFRLPGKKWDYDIVRAFVGGDTCPGNPVPAGTYTTGAPYTDSGSTTGANNTVTTLNVGCSDYATVAGPDHIYSFKISARGAAPQISMTTSTATYDPAIYILNGTTGTFCPAGTGNVVTNCLQGADAGLAGQGEVVSSAEVNTLPLNTPLYLFVDSFYSTAAGNGAYTVRFEDMTIVGNSPAQHVVDFNGDGKTDYAVVRNTGGGPSGQVTWFTSADGTNQSNAAPWGIATDFFVPADYDGDAKTDFAVWRSAAADSAAYYIFQSGTNTLRTDVFGQTGDDPTVVADYTGDGKADPAVYRAGATAGAQSFWYYRASSGVNSGVIVFEPWGLNGDFPAPGDYDGDGKADFMTQRNGGGGLGLFWLRTNGTNTVSSYFFGTPTDVIVPGDYDGDGKTDIATIRGSGGSILWFVRTSSAIPPNNGPMTGLYATFGSSATDFPSQGDYDGDGKTDVAVWRPNIDPSQNYFFVLGSTSGFKFVEWGQNGDYPVANYNSH
jgi:hypothetical protein